MDSIISIKNVSMRFNLARERVDNIKEYVIKKIKRKIKVDEFYALTDVSFEVKKGDSVGLIGLNGSGKSTMLKVIAGVLKPTCGSVAVNGNVAPLIELGAGFDMELTGRENVFLNGALLGRSRQEMNEVYDDIVKFSEMAEFMDVPVKNYSSGMLSRLGFAIATSGKADILIVDQVLAVGDFRFQEKCINKINSLIAEGTTILFVSHSIEQVRDICNKVVWLEGGHLKMCGDAGEICDKYQNS